MTTDAYIRQSDAQLLDLGQVGGRQVVVRAGDRIFDGSGRTGGVLT